MTPRNYPAYTTHAWAQQPQRRGKGLPLYAATVLQLFIALAALWLTRLGFYAWNSDLTGHMDWADLWRACAGGLRFDLSATAYFNALFILMRFWPTRLAWRKWWLRAGNVVYTVCNSLLLVLSIGDIPFYRFTGSRLRWHSFLSLWDDPNMGNIMFSYTAQYWWAYLLGIVAVAGVVCAAWLIKVRPLQARAATGRGALLGRIGLLVIVGGVTFLCMRGRIGTGYPLSIGDAVWYARNPAQVNVVLNTPFSMLRSMSRNHTVEPLRFYKDDQLERLRTSHHRPVAGKSFTPRNVVVIAIEGGGSVWLDSLAVVPLDSERRGLMPFLDSLASRSLTVRHAFPAGKMSIEGITGIFAGMPAFNGFLYLSSPYNGHSVDSPARLLKDEGYSTAFYFGGAHGSYGIDHLMHTMGFDKVTSRETFGPDAPFDGHWGIYDHYVADYMVRDLSAMPQPFMAGWFTLNPHGPWDVPADWQADGYRSRPGSMERVVEYEDRVMRDFFQKASRQPWYPNTLFVITGDHGFRDLKGWDSDWVQPHIMMMFFTPDGSLQPGVVEDTAMSQWDISPTVMGLLGYPKTYVSVGRDIFNEGPGYAVDYINGAYQVNSPRMMVRLDDKMQQITAIYNTVTDPKVQHNLLPPSAGTPATAPKSPSYDAAEVNRMVSWGRAFIQDYTTRLTTDRLGERRD